MCEVSRVQRREGHLPGWLRPQVVPQSRFGTSAVLQRPAASMYWQIPGQCFDNKQKSDKKFDCLDRSDEIPYGTKTRPPLDLSRLETCTVFEGRPGLSCTSGGKTVCHRMQEWCHEYRANQCDELGWEDPATGEWMGPQPTNHPELCANATFWRNMKCEGNSLRCTGRLPGECWWTNPDGTGKICRDQSNNITHPLKGNMCQNDTHFQCKNMKGEESCLPLTLMCDMHPQCIDGLDEQDCEDQYKKRGFIEETASYRCQSRHHNNMTGTPTVWIWSTKCDLITECFQVAIKT